MNLQEHIPDDPLVQAEWGFPSWKHDGWVAKIPLLRSNWTLQAGLGTQRILRDLQRRSARLDALFFHTQVTAVLSTNWLRQYPSIVSLDCTPRQYDRLGAFYNHPVDPAWLESWKWHLNRDCFHLARHIVAWSEWAKQGLVDEYDVPADKITVIPPGVDVEAWAPTEPMNSRPRPVRILFVGGDLERKGGRILLDAFRQLREQVPALPDAQQSMPLELHLVTRTPVTPEPGICVYQDMQPNSERLRDLFFTCDIFCLPTFGDCLPMVLMEAGAAGLPTVSTNVAAIPEIVHDGETGFLAPPGDTEALAFSLQKLIQDPLLRLRQGRAARQIVRERYDIRQNTHRLLDLMKKISAPSGRSTNT